MKHSQNILGVIPVFVRPPFGSGVDKPLVMNTLGELGFQVVTWDTDTNDWQGKSTSECLSVYKNAYCTTTFPYFASCLGITDSKKWYKTVGTPQKRDQTWTCTDSDKDVGP
ncbi:carbohydrate esterase family 4 protein [Rhizophagus clarus]|uniref:Carbohydrate esterase family 4 protein n=1 Tax=Rhizophagus clarus TaxID=94130 RepID=A0A8H3LGF2_9GLOM|nr:carbohydrate esterase family 4 protein [Rhizophagus clarus]